MTRQRVPSLPVPPSWPVSVLFSLVLACGAVVAASAQPAETPDPAPAPEPLPAPWNGDLGKLNPKAPPETAQFAFLIGDWSCATRFANAKGDYAEGTARWIGAFILDGWAIQDWWISPLPGGGEYHSTVLRSFNRETGRWDNRWLQVGNLKWKYYSAEKVRDTMVLTGGEGEDERGAYLDRFTFYDIGAEAWNWRKDRSWDGGETWTEGLGHVACSRGGSAAPAKD